MEEREKVPDSESFRGSPTHPTAEAIASLGARASRQAWESMARELLENAAAAAFNSGLVPEAVTRERVALEAERLKTLYNPGNKRVKDVADQSR